MIFFRDLIESPEVDAKAEGAVLLLDEEDRHAVQRVRGADETVAQVLVQELSEGRHLRFGKQIHPSYWRLGTLVEVYFEVVGSVQRERTGLGFAEDIPEFVIFFRDTGNIYRIGVSSKTSSRIGIRDRDRENSVALNTSQARISGGVNKRNGW